MSAYYINYDKIIKKFIEILRNYSIVETKDLCEKMEKDTNFGIKVLKILINEYVDDLKPINYYYEKMKNVLKDEQIEYFYLKIIVYIKYKYVIHNYNNNYVIDDNLNVFSIIRMTEDISVKTGKCKNCYGCFDCIDCDNCLDCDNCFKCERSINCIDHTDHHAWLMPGEK